MFWGPSPLDRNWRLRPSRNATRWGRLEGSRRRRHRASVRWAQCHDDRCRPACLYRHQSPLYVTDRPGPAGQRVSVSHLFALNVLCGDWPRRQRWRRRRCMPAGGEMAHSNFLGRERERSSLAALRYVCRRAVRRARAPRLVVAVRPLNTDRPNRRRRRDAKYKCDVWRARSIGCDGRTDRRTDARQHRTQSTTIWLTTNNWRSIWSGLTAKSSALKRHHAAETGQQPVTPSVGTCHDRCYRRRRVFCHFFRRA